MDQHCRDVEVDRSKQIRIHVIDVKSVPEQEVIDCSEAKKGTQMFAAFAGKSSFSSLTDEAINLIEVRNSLCIIFKLPWVFLYWAPHSAGLHPSSRNF